MLEVKDQGLHSQLGIKGRMHLQLFGPDGILKDERIVENTITNLMDEQVADQMSDQGNAAIGYMSVGTGSGQGASDTGLATVLDRNALDSTTQQAGADDNDVLYVASWAAGDGTGAITEAGIFRADDDATMMTYADFSAINKGAADTLTINWTVTFGAS